jgi:hypothetical protein
MKIKLIPILFLGLFAAQVANADALSDKIREDMLREIAENHARDLDGIPNEERDGSLEGWTKTEIHAVNPLYNHCNSGCFIYIAR